MPSYSLSQNQLYQYVVLVFPQPCKVLGRSAGGMREEEITIFPLSYYYVLDIRNITGSVMLPLLTISAWFYGLPLAALIFMFNQVLQEQQ